MIELVRYARVKPEGLVSAAVVEDGTLVVSFKRFSVENGREIEPEKCSLTFDEIKARRDELRQELAVCDELLALRPEG